MALNDHFRPPLSEQRPWESFHATWCSSLADYLNDELLPPGYIALEQVHRGPGIEIDVATFSNGAPAGDGVETGTRTLPKAVWTPVTAPSTFAAEFLDRFTVEVHSTEGGRTLAAAIELVSPGNKDRHSKRRLFAAKCAAYLAQGVGLVVVDVVSTRQANMHHELVDLWNLGEELYMPDSPYLYVAGYRPTQQNQEGTVDCWSFTLAIGEELPEVPLSIAAECCLQIYLNVSYENACRRRRIDEVK